MEACIYELNEQHTRILHIYDNIHLTRAYRKMLCWYFAFNKARAKMIHFRSSSVKEEFSTNFIVTSCYHAMKQGSGCIFG